MSRVIKKILIANRGEIACRIIKTCGKMGISTVAVYSDADAKALHVEMADEAYPIGAAPPRESYLNIDKIIAAAKQSGADAIHPGYGFLSENAGFAEAVAQAGLIFIGPPPSAIRAMGGKSEAKALMEKAGVPLVPGYHGENQDEVFLSTQAEKIGWPVLIKASAGGGGKGMRVVENAESFVDALAGAKREAKSAFGDDRVLIEKYVASPRHVEIQVFADSHGDCVYLFERDCSIQRRHQKVLEEAPAPGMTQALREKMGAAAVSAAKAIAYQGAGTVEFLLDAQGHFYFMEMNTRLQVEHPVTEMITGLDLVAWQICVAQGEKLPLTQKDLKIDGHAFEARLYAEDPANNFLPGAGQIRYLHFPASSARIDTGVRGGDTITIHYDPMIAKIIAWGKDRDEALCNMAKALDETQVAGPKSNLNFLRALVKHKAFRAGDVSTHFIEKHRHDLLPENHTPSPETLIAAATALMPRPADTSDPWSNPSAWRIGADDPPRFTFKSGDKEYEARAGIMPAGVIVDRDGTRLTVMSYGVTEEMTHIDPLSLDGIAEAKEARLAAPMPGKVVAIHAKAGGAVKKGQPLIVVEAMKMEHTIIAPFDGVISAVNASVGDQVDEKRALVAFQ